MAINRDFSSIGGDLEGTLADLRMVPDQVLASYSQNATPLAKGNVTLGLAVTSELARRKGIRQEQAAKENPDPQGLPTVLQGLLSGQMSGPGGTPAPAAGISAFSQQPRQPQQTQQPQQIVLNQPKTATAPTFATPYSAPKLPTPPSQLTRKMAQGGIVALAGGGDPGKQEPGESFEDFRKRVFEEELVRQQERNAEREVASDRARQASEEERLRRLAQRAPNLGMRRPFDPLVPEGPGPAISGTPYPETAATRSILRDRSGVTSLLREPSVSTPTDTSPRASSAQTTTSELEQSLIRDGVTNPDERAFIINKLRTEPNITYRHVPTTSSPSPTASDIPDIEIPSAGTAQAGLGSLRQMLLQKIPTLYEQAGTNRTFSPEAAEKARTEAAKRLKDVVDPRMAEIQKLLEQQKQIAMSDQQNYLPNMLTSIGSAILKGQGARPGTGVAALANAVEAAKGYQDRDTQLRIATELKQNQYKIDLQKDLMRQGVDQITASNVAEREARREFELADTESRRTAGTQMDILKAGATVEAQAEAEQRRVRALDLAIRRAADRNKSNEERRYNNYLAEFLQQGMDPAQASFAAQRRVDDLQRYPTEARVSAQVLKRVADRVPLDPRYRAAKTTEAKAAVEQEILDEEIRKDEALRKGSPRPGAGTPSSSSEGSGSSKYGSMTDAQLLEQLKGK